MPRDIGVYLEDMLEAATRLAEYVRGLDLAVWNAATNKVPGLVEPPRRLLADKPMSVRCLDGMSAPAGDPYRTPSS